MGLIDAIKALLGFGPPRPTAYGDLHASGKVAPQVDVPKRGGKAASKGGFGPHDVNELARRLGMSVADLKAVRIDYARHTIRKRRGGTRELHAPSATLKHVQRLILRRLLGRLRVHEAATGFEPSKSIVTNANLHAGGAVVVRMDIREFFPSTRSSRIAEYFGKIGWNEEATDLLVKLCTHEGGLPQGAPTSPRLANLVNFRLDEMLSAFADQHAAVYSRYADDLTFSFEEDDHNDIAAVISCTRATLEFKFDYELHMKKKLSIRRAYEQQRVTGLVVNERVNLPRKTRRWLRAVKHRAAGGVKQPTLKPAQIKGWEALELMVRTQRDA